MIKDNMLFHNITQMTYNEEIGGYTLSRLPYELVDKLKFRTGLKVQLRDNYKKPASAEMRFVLLDEKVKIKIYCTAIEKINIFYGDIEEKTIVFDAGYHELEIEMPERVKALDPTEKIKLFTPNVVRVVFWGLDNRSYYISKQGNTRLPNYKELPSKTLLAYGTSITNGTDTSSEPIKYIAQTARNINMDLINLGVGGGAFCEQEIVDYITAQQNWDMAVFCVSVNMITQSYTLDEYAEKVENLITTVSTAHPTKHIFCISPYTFSNDFSNFMYRGLADVHPDEYRQKVKNAVEKTQSEYVHYVNGREMLKDASGLCPDLIHPSELGMIEIANNLSKVIIDTLN